MSHTIAGVTISDANMHVGTREASPYYMQQTEVHLVDGKFHAYVNEFPIATRDEVDDLIVSYSSRDSRMGVAFS